MTTATLHALPPLPPTPAAAREPAPSAPAVAPPQMPESAPPGMRRCVRADGSTVFTDRRCELMEATPEGLPAGEPPAPRVASPTPPQVVRVRTCARSQGELLEGVRGALEARDANRFAEFYHWTEMGTVEGYQLMERLARFTDRTLVDLQLMTSQERAEQDSRGTRAPAPWFPRAPAAPIPTAPIPATPPDAAANPATPAGAAPPRRVFDLLRVEQLRGEDGLDTQDTWFHLRSNAGCWWLQF